MSSNTAFDPELLKFLQNYLTDERKALMERIASQRTRHFTVVLDDIFHSHNAAAVLRNCDCFGIQDVHIIESRYDWDRHPKIDRGSAQWLSTYRYRNYEDNAAECVRQLREGGYRIAAATPQATATIDDMDIKQPVAFVFGAEKRGISEEVLAEADLNCQIPMYGFTESFNVSVAVALTLHAMRRRMKEEITNWQLTDLEKDVLYFHWSKNSIRHWDRYVRTFYARQQQP